MLTLYVCPKRRPRYQPTVDQLTIWFNSTLGGALLTAPETKVNFTKHHTSTPLSFTPGMGVIQLFNQDAKDALLPVELTFESLELCFTSSPTLLPPEMKERTQCCPQCGDEVSEDALRLALTKLEFVPFERSTIFCQSCQDDISIKRLEFEPPSSFATFWIRLDEVGSSRLNPVLLRDWGQKLGCPLDLLIDQKENDFQEITLARQESDIWRDFDQNHPSPEINADLFGVQPRQSYRESRYQRRQQERKQRGKRKMRSSSAHSRHSTRKKWQEFDE